MPSGRTMPGTRTTGITLIGTASSPVSVTGPITGGSNAVELASASGAGTLAGSGTSVTNFTSPRFDGGALVLTHTASAHATPPVASPASAS